MNLRNVLKWRPVIYGFCALWIMFFHINRRFGMPVNIPVISAFLSMGNMGVDIFLFFSGCCNYLSFDKNPRDMLGFYKRRLGRILFPYLIIVTPFWIWRSALEYPLADGSFYWIRFLGDISSATFWLTGVQTVWFVFTIALFYFLFPLFYRVIQRGVKSSAVLLAFIYILNITALCVFPLYEKSSIAWTRLPVFIVGAAAGKYTDYLDLGRLKKSFLSIARWGSAIILFVFVAVIPLNDLIDYVRLPSEALWMLYMPMTLLFVLLLCSFSRDKSEYKAVAGSKCFNTIRTVVGLVGGVSLETYMIHIILLHVIDFYGMNTVIGYLAYLIVPIVTFAIVAPISKLNRMLNKKTLTKGKKRIS